MNIYTDLCCSFRVPLWVAPLLHAASRLRSDPARRRRTYRLIQRHLMRHRVGCSGLNKPTYVYPPEIKEMVRTAFPGGICDYQDPSHQNVFIVTMDVMNSVSSTDQS